jgi:chromosome segregation ATPase
MTQPPDLEARVARLETQVHDLEERVRHGQQDAAAARVLAGGADRDVTEMRTEIREFREQNARLHNATREDLNDLRSRVEDGFGQVDARFAQVDARFAQVDAGFAEMRGKLDAAAAGQQQIVDLLNTLIADGGQAGEQ